MLFKEGDIILVNFKSGIGKIIQDFTDEKYGHGCIYIGDNKIIEANFFHNVSEANLSKYNGLSIAVLRLKDNIKGLSIVKIARKYLNNKYDWYSIIFLFFFYLYYRLTGKHLNISFNPLNDKNRFYCFELIAYVLDEAGYKIKINKSLVTGKYLMLMDDIFDIIRINKLEV